MNLRPRTPAAAAEAAPREGAADAGIGAVLAGARIYVDVTVPRTAVKGKLRLLSRGEERSLDLELAR